MIVKDYTVKQMLPKPFALLLGLLLCSLLQAQTITRTDTFRYSGGIVQWTVPNGVTALVITARGAAGSTRSDDTYAAGLGTYVKGDFAATPGTVFKILVGGKPGGAEGNHNGGGSFVTDVANNPLLIAGGGANGGKSFVAGGAGGIDNANESAGFGGGGIGTFGGGGSTNPDDARAGGVGGGGGSYNGGTNKTATAGENKRSRPGNHHLHLPGH